VQEQHDPFDIHEYGNVLLDTGFDKHRGMSACAGPACAFMVISMFFAPMEG
jgi:hypothetical protein